MTIHHDPIPNPFATFARVAPVDPFRTPEPPAGETGFALVASRPAIDPAEVEDAATAALEVRIAWGGTTLHVAHLTPPRPFSVGEEASAAGACDFLLPSEKLGTTRLPLVTLVSGVPAVVVPSGAKATIELPGRPKTTLAEAGRAGLLEPCMEAPDASMFRLSTGAKVAIEIGDLTLTVASVAAGKRIAPPVMAAASATGLMFVGLSMLAHLGILSGMAFFRPAMADSDDDAARKEQVVLMSQLLKASAEREEEAKQEDTRTPEDGASQGTGAPAKGSSGSMGTPETTKQNGRFSIKGPAENKDPRLAREAARQEAAHFGLIGLLEAGVAGDPRAPTAPWGDATAIGNDAESFRGKLWGGTIGDANGAGGLGLWGTGEGGDGRTNTIGLGAVETVGHGMGLKDGDGFGRSHGKVDGDHEVKKLVVRQSSPTVSGHIPPDVIQRIVRQSYGRFRGCYEAGLRTNPNLQGRVAVRFVIDRNGSVANVMNGGSDLPDASVVSCVVRSFAGLSFPAPEAGIVTVVYPISFSVSGS